jgi:hypothetical protein
MVMPLQAIDVWYVDTFDEDLTAKLRANADLIHDSIMTDQRIDLEREASDHKGPSRDIPCRGISCGSSRRLVVT